MMASVNRELVERLSIAPDAFTGQTALVTGGARGIGEATATALGVLEMPSFDQLDEADVSGPLSGIYIKQYLGRVSATNKEFEHRIEVRTRELAEAKERSDELLVSILPAPIARRLESARS